jgi:uncharacterized protein (TIGR02611 family)
VSSSSQPRRPTLSERLARRRERHLQRSRAYRAIFVVAGGLVTIGGLAMLVLPGPAFVIIPIGLTMLAMEFDWAERWLVKALARAERARHSATNASPRQKALAAGAIALGIAAFVVAAILWDIPGLPVV